MSNLYQELGVKNVLIAAIDPWIKDSLEVYFQIQGCGLRSVDSAKEALAALPGEHFDLILCEYHLPDMDGVSLLKICGDSHPLALRLLMSAYPTHQVEKDAARSGIHEVILKPFTTEALEESLKRHLRKPRPGEFVSVE